MPDVEHAHTFTVEGLREAVSLADGPVLVDFWEPRCSACRATLDVVDRLACRVEGRGVVGTFNVREHADAARALGVTTVPTLMVFRDGAVESILQGAERIQAFLERIDEEVFFGRPPTCER
jgi:thioredoxin 1